MITRSLEDIVAGPRAKKANLAKLAKKWATKLEQFEVVLKTKLFRFKSNCFRILQLWRSARLIPPKIMAF